MTDYMDLLPVAMQAVDLAARRLRTQQPGAITPKGDRDLASALDYAIEAEVCEFLHGKTPHVGFLGEEGGASSGEPDLTWALDPIDGTVNFVHGLPLCAVSLGLIHRDRPVLGVIDLPFLGWRYHAVDGHGAHENGQRINTTQPSSLADALVAIGDYAVGEGAEQKNRDRLAVTACLVPAVQRIRMHGAAAIDLAWLASGRLDAVVILSNRPWDTSAGVVLAREAGAEVVDLDGTVHTTASTSTIAASGLILAEILPCVRNFVAK